MSESPFDTPPPAGGDKFVNAEHEGELLIVKVHGTGRETFDNGESEFIIADITVVDGREPGAEFVEAWLFGRVIFGQLKRRQGHTLLGRLVKGQAQRGKSAPWQLDPASEADTALALRYMNRATRPDAPAPEPARAGGGSFGGDSWATGEFGGDQPPF